MDVFIDASRYSGQSLVDKEISFSLPCGETGHGKIVDAGKTPYSKEELAKLLESDFLANSLLYADYSYVLDVDPMEDLSDHDLEIGEVTIITKEVPPISFLLQ